ncbi:MAG TPA: hypothetical protein PKY77_26820 [Phycisphaerae bacterium]|nr:hypothetical protein [Phycisphaerae bacterium]
MPRLTFRNFSDLGFIQAIDKPLYMAPLLAPHAEYFDRQGIDVTKLKNDDATDRRLLRIFTQPDEGMPAELLEALYSLDDLADESGHDRILDEATRQGISLNGDELTPGEFAIVVHSGHPGLIRVCREKTNFQKIRNYQEYQAKQNTVLTVGAAKKKQGQLEEALAPWFESKNRSRACEIWVYEERGEIKFLITHGRPLLTEGSIDKKLRRSRVAYRPQKHDSVIYDNRLHVLRINAQTVGEKDVYREQFGRVLFGDADHFPGRDIYTLAPLRRGANALRLAGGIDTVRLSEVWIEVDNGQHFVQISKAYNLGDSITQYGRPNLAEGRLVRASFLIKYSSGGRPRKLELRPPNVAIFDRDRDGDAAEAFMRANGYLRPRPGDGGMGA